MSQLSNGSNIINGSESDSDDSALIQQQKQQKQRPPLDDFISSSSSEEEDDDEDAVPVAAVVKDSERRVDNFLDEVFPDNGDDAEKIVERTRKKRAEIKRR